MMTLFMSMSHAGIGSSEVTPQQVSHNRVGLSLSIYDKVLSAQDLAFIHRNGM